MKKRAISAKDKQKTVIEMQQDTYRAYEPTESQYPLREYRRTRRQTDENDEENSKKGDFLIRVVAVQLLVCALVVLLVFGLYKSGSPSFQTLKNTCSEMFAKDMDSAELKETLQRVSAFVFQPQSDKTETEPSAQSEDESLPTENTAADDLTGAGGEDLLYATEKTSFSPLTVAGTFTVPVEYTRVTSKFGYRVNPVTNEYGFHSGIDLAAPEGTPIRAAFTGTVKQVASSAGRGNYIVLSHDNGLETMYCHCSEIIAVEGENIRSGEVIALVGSTGQATGPHLHLELWLNGIRYDPAWVLGLYATEY